MPRVSRHTSPALERAATPADSGAPEGSAQAPKPSGETDAFERVSARSGLERALAETGGRVTEGAGPEPRAGDRPLATALGADPPIGTRVGRSSDPGASDLAGGSPLPKGLPQVENPLESGKAAPPRGTIDGLPTPGPSENPAGWKLESPLAEAPETGATEEHQGVDGGAYGGVNPNLSRQGQQSDGISLGTVGGVGGFEIKLGWKGSTSKTHDPAFTDRQADRKAAEREGKMFRDGRSSEAPSNALNKLVEKLAKQLAERISGRKKKGTGGRPGPEAEESPDRLDPNLRLKMTRQHEATRHEGPRPDDHVSDPAGTGRAAVGGTEALAAAGARPEAAHEHAGRIPAVLVTDPAEPHEEGDPKKGGVRANPQDLVRDPAEPHRR